MREFRSSYSGFRMYSCGGALASTEPVDRRSHAEDDRWPRKSSVKTITANNEFALAA